MQIQKLRVLHSVKNINVSAQIHVDFSQKKIKSLALQGVMKFWRSPSDTLSSKRKQDFSVGGIAK